MIGQGHYCKNCRGHWSENCGCSSSDASACSGEDAREADKALDRCEMEIYNNLPTVPPISVTFEAAVSPRSSDGLLPCPFCGGLEFIVAKATQPYIACWNCGSHGPPSVLGTIEAIAKDTIRLWNQRASGSQAK